MTWLKGKWEFDGNSKILIILILFFSKKAGLVSPTRKAAVGLVIGGITKGQIILGL